MFLHQLKPAPGSRTPKRIVGRGEGSTLGQTCGKGQKGQTCRSGERYMNGFEGGQTPLMRRIPKRGFNRPSRINFVPINLDVLEARFDAGAEVSGATLANAGIIKKESTPFKILGTGKISKKLNVVGGRISKSAEEAVKKAGGSIKKAETKSV